MFNTSTEETKVKSEESTTSVEDVTVKVTDFVKTDEAIITSVETDREVCNDKKLSKLYVHKFSFKLIDWGTKYKRINKVKGYLALLKVNCTRTSIFNCQ